MSVLPSEMSDDEIEEILSMEEISQMRVIHTALGSNQHPKVGDLLKTNEAQEKRIAKLRGYLVDCINLGTDGTASVDVSDEFLSHAPKECEAIKKKLDIRKHCRA